MELNIRSAKYGIREGVVLPNLDILKQLKENGVRQMVSDHYDLLVNSAIQEMFPSNPLAIEKAKEHSADFFIQILGGPNYFNQNRGKPRLAQRHERFKITPAARIVWLECYREVLQKLELPENLILSFWNYLNVFSNWMVNTPENHIPNIPD